ncbi:MAG: NAD(P)H-hydrate dehydratase [Verrucomicrobiales bacterium]|nr:NAD(P)H-hydrate dehydratase [Verrucomicrobiales bacterium]
MPELIVTSAEMRAREERTWAAGVSRESVILRAGVAVASVALRMTRPNDPVLVLAGRGHNGSDAVVADEHLADRDSTLVRFGDPRSLAAAEAWMESYRGDPRALVIDGMVGIGLDRPLEGDWLRVVRVLNASRMRVVAVDVPTGLNADTGEPMGDAVEAAVTVTLGAVKGGLLRDRAARYVGRLELAPRIGLVPTATEGALAWTLESDFHGYPWRRADDSHKGSYGHVGLLAGSLGYHGAGVLAAQGALRARPGLVTLLTDERCYVPAASALRAAMVVPWSGERVDVSRFTALVVGPGLASRGLSPTLRDEVRRLWRESECPVLADASALDWLPDSVAEQAGPRIMTPHPGEAARLLGTTVAEVQSDRVCAVRRLARFWDRTSTVAVLKGRHTILGQSDGCLFVNGTGNPGLAQGGTGDVLAGYLGGLIAQPALAKDLIHAVRYGVWRHGLAADQLEFSGARWTAEDLAEALGRSDP